MMDEVLRPKPWRLCEPCMPVRRFDVRGIVAASNVEGLAAAVDVLPIGPDAAACRRLPEGLGPHTRQHLAKRIVGIMAGEVLSGEPR